MANVEVQTGPAAAVPARKRTQPSAYFAFLAAVATACGFVWLAQLRSSLSIDEAGTFWVIKDGLANTFSRSLEFQGQSPLYYVLDWIALKTFGHTELALRIPSLTATALTLIPIYRLGERLFDQETALLATASFAATSSVAFSSADARPYSLALLFASLATLKLVRWLDSGSKKDHVLYIVFAALTVYVHYLYAIVLIAHAMYAAARRRNTSVSHRKLLLSPLLISLACLPLAPQFLALLRRSTSLSWTGDPSLRQLVLATRAPLLLAAAGIAFVAARRVSRTALPWVLAPFVGVALVASLGGVRILRSELVKSAGGPKVVAAAGVIVAIATVAFLVKRYGSLLNPLPDLSRDRDGLVLAIALALVPPLATFCVSAASSVDIFTPRYFFSATPGVVLLAAWAIRRAGPQLVRVGLVFVILGTALGLMRFEHSPDDWQSAIRTLNASASAGQPVLVSAGFIEANQASWLSDPEKAAFTLSPVAFYPVKGRVIPMPFDPIHEAAPYVDRVAQDMDAQTFFVLTNKLHLLADVLAEKLEGRGYRAQIVARYGWLQITQFDRT